MRIAAARVARFIWEGASYLFSRVVHILYKCDTEFGEILAGFLAIGWGLILLTPEGKDTILAITPIPVWLWGLSILALGVAHMVGVLVPVEALRKQAAYIGVPVWLGISFLIFYAGHLAIGYFAYGLFALTCCWIFVRRAMDDFRREQRIYSRDTTHTTDSKPE